MFVSLYYLVFYGFGIILDFVDLICYMVFFGQGGLGLFDCDYYFDEENEVFGCYCEVYVVYIEMIFDFVGIEGGVEKVVVIMELEICIVGVYWIQVESCDIQCIYNLMILEQMDVLVLVFNLFVGMVSMGLVEVLIFLVV